MPVQIIPFNNSTSSMFLEFTNIMNSFSSLIIAMVMIGGIGILISAIAGIIKRTSYKIDYEENDDYDDEEELTVEEKQARIHMALGEQFEDYKEAQEKALIGSPHRKYKRVYKNAIIDSPEGLENAYRNSYKSSDKPKSILNKLRGVK